MATMASAQRLAGACGELLPTPRRQPRAVPRRAVSGGVRTLSSFGGLKAQNEVSAPGCKSTEHHFATIVAAMSKRSSSRGGAACSTCNVSSEIFRVVPIMSGLVLAGVALGFVLLRVEAAIEEAEE